MHYRIFVLLAATLALCACNVPAGQTAAAGPASSSTYQEPPTGSLLSGGDASATTNGFNDPGMGNHISPAGGR